MAIRDGFNRVAEGVVMSMAEVGNSRDWIGIGMRVLAFLNVVIGVGDCCVRRVWWLISMRLTEEPSGCMGGLGLAVALRTEYRPQ